MHKTFKPIKERKNIMNANLELIKQEIITGSEELNSSKEVYEFKSDSVQRW